jgi:hypothetical protein
MGSATSALDTYSAVCVSFVRSLDKVGFVVCCCLFHDNKENSTHLGGELPNANVLYAVVKTF